MTTKVPNAANASIALGTRITPELYQRLFQIAKDKDWTLSQLIRNALEYYVANGKKKEKKVA